MPHPFRKLRYIAILFALIIVAAPALWYVVPRIARESALQLHQWTWNRIAPAHYKFILRAECVCMPSHVGPTTVEVKNGKVISIHFHGDTRTDVPDWFKSLSTIDHIFSLLHAEIWQPGRTVVVTYDDKIGYPLTIASYVQKGFDDEDFYSIDDFASLD